MKNILVIVQDYKTLQIIEQFKVTDIQSVKKDEFLNTEDFGKDLFFVKEIREVIKNELYYVLAKCNKKSELYLKIKERFSTPLFPYNGLMKMEKQIQAIINEKKKKKTHIQSIVKKGSSKIAKKFGEEAVELVIESGKEDDTHFKDEAADVLYYYLILLHERGFTLEDIIAQLKAQNRKN